MLTSVAFCILHFALSNPFPWPVNHILFATNSINLLASLFMRKSTNLQIRAHIQSQSERKGVRIEMEKTESIIPFLSVICHATVVAVSCCCVNAEQSERNENDEDETKMCKLLSRVRQDTSVRKEEEMPKVNLAVVSRNNLLARPIRHLHNLVYKCGCRSNETAHFKEKKKPKSPKERMGERGREGEKVPKLFISINFRVDCVVCHTGPVDFQKCMMMSQKQLHYTLNALSPLLSHSPAAAAAADKLFKSVHICMYDFVQLIKYPQKKRRTRR